MVRCGWGCEDLVIKCNAGCTIAIIYNNVVYAQLMSPCHPVQEPLPRMALYSYA